MTLLGSALNRSGAALQAAAAATLVGYFVFILVMLSVRLYILNKGARALFWSSL